MRIGDDVEVRMGDYEAKFRAFLANDRLVVGASFLYPKGLLFDVQSRFGKGDESLSPGAVRRTGSMSGLESDSRHMSFVLQEGDGVTPGLYWCDIRVVDEHVRLEIDVE